MKREKIVFDRFSNLDKGEKGTLVSYASKNCEACGGELTTGIGLTPYILPNGEIGVPHLTMPVKQIVIIKEYEAGMNATIDRPYYVATSGHVACYNYQQTNFMLQMYFEKGMRMVRSRNVDGIECIVMYGSQGVYYYRLTNGVINCTTTPMKSIGCVHGDRVFTVRASDSALVYNDPLKRQSIEESVDNAGELICSVDSGEIVALQSVKEYLYVFYEREIFRMKALGVARDFVVERVPYAGGKIKGETVGRLGKYLLFIANDEIWRLDTQSKQSKRICNHLNIAVAEDQEYCQAVPIDNKFFLYYNDKESDGYKTVAIDPDKEEIYYPFAAEGMSYTDGRALCCDGFQFYEYDKDGALPSWEDYTYSAKTDFGLESEKVLRTLSFEGEGECTLTLTIEGKLVKKELKINGNCSFDIFERGRVFDLKFVLGKGAKIKKMTAEIQHRGGT